jgi:5'-3' exonuclease
VNEERPERISCSCAGLTFRDEIDGDYGQPQSDARCARASAALRPRVIEALWLRCLEIPGVEADDVIATRAGFASEPIEVSS